MSTTSESTTRREATAPFDARQLATLGAAMLGFFVVALDAQIVNVALADIGSSLDTGLSGLQWIVTGYTLAFSALILLAGTLSDRIGARRAYVAGMVLFAIASAACGLASDVEVLTAARLVQGAGAALVTPTSLALIREGFTDGRQRTRAIGLWAVGGSVAAAAGPIAGGALTGVSWRLIFLVNIPVVLAALLLASRVAPSPRRTARFDVAGQVSAVIALGSFTFAVIEGPSRGWSDPRIAGMLVVAALTGVLFVLTQARGRHPMVPLRMFGSTQLSIALAIAFTSMAAFYGVVFVQSLYFQQERGQTALMTGALFLPMTVAVTIVSAMSGRLVERFGRRGLIIGGLLVQGTGLVLLACLPSTAPVWLVAAAMIPVGAGGSTTVPPVASLVLDNAPAEIAGTVSGVLNTFRQLGGSLGVAMVGAVIAAHATFMPGLRTGLALTAAVLVVSTALAFGLRPPPTTPHERLHTDERNTMHNVTLNNGVEMPILGFGVFQISDDETQAAVEAALAAGYRHLDTAASYGNEEAVGAAIKASGIARDELFVTTKLWIQHAPTGSVEDNTKRAFDLSLGKLGLDHLDLYLIHQPLGDYYSEWRAMQTIYADGGTRAIGVSNFHPDRLVDLIDHNDVVPAVNQIETHPFHQRVEDQDLMRERGVQIESWGPFAEGKNDLFTNRVLAGIGEKHDKSVAQVVLRWLVQRDVVAIPKSVNPDRMAQNIDVFDFELTSEQMDEIATLEDGNSQFFDHRDPAMVSWLGGRHD